MPPILPSRRIPEPPPNRLRHDALPRSYPDTPEGRAELARALRRERRLFAGLVLITIALSALMAWALAHVAKV